MKHFKLMTRKKGFTLAECIVALAVFAVLTSMVLMIMSSTVNLSKKASDNEEDLNNVVQNVVRDDTNKVYGNDSDTFSMIIGDSNSYNEDSPDFRMSYTTVDGYRNYVECPGCGYTGNNLEFMEAVYSSTDYTAASAEDKNAHKISYWFKQNMDFKCPKCSHEFKIPDLECQSCGKKSTSGDTAAFYYDKATGCFYCNTCGSSNVRPESIQASVTADSPFMVSGMSANAVRYGSIKFPTDHSGQIDLDSDVYGSADTFNVSLSYAEDSNPNRPGVYTLKVSGLSGAIDAAATSSKVLFRFPGNYQFKIEDTANPGKYINGVLTTISLAGTTVIPHNAVDPTTDDSMLEFLVTGAPTGDSITVQFSLLNDRNQNDFAFDYPDGNVRNDKSLREKWFGLSSDTNASVTIDKTS